MVHFPARHVWLPEGYICCIGSTPWSSEAPRFLSMPGISSAIRLSKAPKRACSALPNRRINWDTPMGFSHRILSDFHRDSMGEKKSETWKTQFWFVLSDLSDCIFLHFFCFILGRKLCAKSVDSRVKWWTSTYAKFTISVQRRKIDVPVWKWWFSIAMLVITRW